MSRAITILILFISVSSYLQPCTHTVDILRYLPTCLDLQLLHSTVDSGDIVPLSNTGISLIKFPLPAIIDFVIASREETEQQLNRVVVDMSKLWKTISSELYNALKLPCGY